MAKAKIAKTQPTVAKTVGDRVNAGVAKMKEIGKNIGKNVGAAAKDLGNKAKAHAVRNKAAYIAGGAGLAAGAVGGAVLARRKRSQD
jgi:hypothetical protein